MTNSIDEPIKQLPYLKLNTDSLQIIHRLTDAQIAELMKAILYFHATNDLPEFSDKVVEIAIIPIVQHLQKCQEKYDLICKVNAINGGKGGKKTKEINDLSKVAVGSVRKRNVATSSQVKLNYTNLNSTQYSTSNILYEFWQNQTGKTHNSENAKKAAMKILETALKQYDLETLQNVVEWYCTNPNIEKQYHGIDNIFRATKMQEKILKVDEWLSKGKQHTIFTNIKKPQYEEVGDFSMYNETNSIQYLNGEKFDASTITNWDEVPEKDRPF